MKYLFQCSNCDTTQEFEMTVADYEKFKPVCKKCKADMKRVFKAPTLGKGCASPAGTNCSGCGENCHGGCGGCSSCGGNGDSCLSC